MYGSGQEAFPDVQERSGGPTECLGVVGRPSRMSGSGRKAYLMYGSGQKAIPNIREWSGETPGSLGVV